MAKSYHNVLVVTYPSQGHINPSLQFAKRLSKLNFNITYLTAFSALNRMAKIGPTLENLNFAGFSDGYDDGIEDLPDYAPYFAHLRLRGPEAVEEIIKSSHLKGQSFKWVVYTTLIPWVGQVAHSHGIRSTLLWAQPATVLDVYYYFTNGYSDTFKGYGNDPSWSIELPGLPRLTFRDVPSFTIDFSSTNFAISMFKNHIDVLQEQNNPKVLVNTVNDLEPEALKAIGKLNLIPIGPLCILGSSSGGDLFQKTEGYTEWLNLMAKGSVIYISFGSVLGLSEKQMDEMAKGLLESQMPFLWVVRGATKNNIVFINELEKIGKIVEWCSQSEVLSHPSIGCFMTHCGWNSSLEALVCGVPVVCVPQWSDQGTNAKLLEDVWEVGVRVRKNEDGFVEGNEIKRCLDIVMGEKGEKFRINSEKWKILTRQAAQEGGSSDLNLKNFIDNDILSL